MLLTHGRRRARTTGCRWNGGGASREQSPNEEGEAKPRPSRRLRAVAVATAALPAGPGRAARAAVLTPGGGTGRDGTRRDATGRDGAGRARPSPASRPAPPGTPAAPSSPLGQSGAGGGSAPLRPVPAPGWVGVSGRARVSAGRAVRGPSLVQIRLATFPRRTGAG